MKSCAGFSLFKQLWRERPHQVISLISFFFARWRAPSEIIHSKLLKPERVKVAHSPNWLQKCFWVSYHCFYSPPFHRCCSTYWIQLSCTASRRGKASSCLARPTLKETIQTALPASSSLRYTGTQMPAVVFSPPHLDAFLPIKPSHFFSSAFFCSLFNYVTWSSFLISARLHTLYILLSLILLYSIT